MGLVSTKIEKEVLKPGDHIYSWRNAYLYAHHGIYVGDEKVIHFTRGAGQEIGTGTVLDRFIFSSPPSHSLDNPCPKCGDQSRLDGVISSCIDCFLSDGNLYLFEYDVSPAFFLAKPQSGTCTLAKSDPPEDVLHRAFFLLQNGFGVHHIFRNNCEDFAIYCKTGLLIMNNLSVGRSGQAASFIAATSAIVSSPLRFLTTSFSGLAAVGYGMYCISRLVYDIGVRRDVSKIPFEQLVASSSSNESEVLADLVASSSNNINNQRSRINYSNSIRFLESSYNGIISAQKENNMGTTGCRHHNTVMEAEDDWESSSGEVTDADQFNDQDIYSTAASLSKLQFRSDVSKAKWDGEIGMAEVIEKKGKMWITTGIVRNGKTFCLIEETLFLAEIGALLVMDENDERLPLKDIYKKIAEEKSGCCWELFEVYRHLKSLGYIVGRPGVPWSMKSVENNSKSCSSQGTIQKNGVVDTEVNGMTCVVQMLSNLQVDELRLNFDVYLPNSKFRKSSPGDPTFLLCLVRGSPPSSAKSEALKRQCGGIPLKFCHVDHGRVENDAVVALTLRKDDSDLEDVNIVRPDDFYQSRDADATNW